MIGSGGRSPGEFRVAAEKRRKRPELEIWIQLPHDSAVSCQCHHRLQQFPVHPRIFRHSLQSTAPIHAAKMFLLRRAAVRSLSSQLPTRSVATKAPAGLRQAQKWQMPAFQRRFASDEASPAQAQTSGQTVTTESERAQQQQTGASVTSEAQAEQEPNVTEKSVATPETADAAGETSTVGQVADKVQEAAYSMRQTASAAAESLLGKRTRDGRSGSGAVNTPGKILYAGNLFFEVTAQDLEREFSKFGTITNCRVAEDSRGLSRGFGFIEFTDVESATAAKREMDNKVLAGRNLAIQFHVRREPRNLERPHTPSAPAKTLFIGNMSFQMSDKDLNDIFRPIKNVVDVRVAVDRRSGQPRGFCHADFVDVPSAEAAKEVLEQKEIYGRRLRVDFSRTNMRPGRSWDSDSSSGGSGSGSGSGGNRY